MALIAVSGSDHPLLMRWSDMAGRSGHDCIILPPSTLRGGLGVAADICLFDLGPRGATDPGALLGAVQASVGTRFVAMTARPAADEGLHLLRGGVRGYCNRLVSAEVFGALLSTVASGEIWAGRQVTDFLLGATLAGDAYHAAPVHSLLDHLTAREVQIAEQVAAGVSNKVIAVDNGISERTVKAHLNNIFRKTGVRNRVQLALAVSRAGGGQRRLSSG